LNAVSDFEGVGGKLVHREFEGDSTTSVVFRKFTQLIGNIGTDRLVESFHDQFVDHLVGELIKSSEVHTTVVLPLEDVGKGDEMAFSQKVECSATIVGGVHVELFVHLNGGKHIKVNETIHQLINGETVVGEVISELGGVFSWIDDTSIGDIAKGILGWKGGSCNVDKFLDTNGILTTLMLGDLWGTSQAAICRK
jgi:hypothetical protein